MLLGRFMLVFLTFYLTFQLGFYLSDLFVKNTLFGDIGNVLSLSIGVNMTAAPLSGYGKEETVSFSNLISLIQSKSGTYGLYIKNLNTKHEFEFNENEEFNAASLFKTPVAVAALKEIEIGNLNMDQFFTYTAEDYSDGTGSIASNGTDVSYSLNEILSKLLSESDNSAQNMLIRILGWSKISSAFVSLKGEGKFLTENIGTPKIISNTFENVLEGAYLNGLSKRFISEVLSSTAFDDRIHSGLDKDVRFIHKIGSFGDEGTWHDCGMVVYAEEKLLVCLMSKNTSFNEFNEISEKTGEFINSLLK